MNENMTSGLAGGIPPSEGMSAPSQITVEQVIQMLMEGAKPEDLARQGVPVELIQAALQQLMQMMEQDKGAQTPAGQSMMGLSNGM